MFQQSLHLLLCVFFPKKCLFKMGYDCQLICNITTNDSRIPINTTLTFSFRYGYFYDLFTFYLEYNYNVVFLLYNDMNQLYVYIYPLRLEPSPATPPLPTPLGHQDTRLFPVLYNSFPLAICFIHCSIYVCVCVSATLSICPTLPFHGG